MSPDDAVLTLRQMLDHAREAVALLKGKQQRDLDTNRTLNPGLVRLVERVEEAARRTPLDVRAQYPQVAWSRIVGVKNRLTRGSDSVDTNVLWEVVTRDLPRLIRELEQIISSDWD